MRYRLMATYRGVSYEAGMGPTDADVVLFASNPPPEEPGFEPAAGGYWRKRISREKLDAIWEARPIGRYRSEPCLVLEEIGHRLHITYLGHDGYRAKRLGYWQVDRGVYEVIVPRGEVTELSEARVDYPVHLNPGAVVPDAVLPDAVVPDAVLPDAVLPDALLPDAVLPDVLPDHEATTSRETLAAAEAAPAPERGSWHAFETPDHAAGHGRGYGHAEWSRNGGGNGASARGGTSAHGVGDTVGARTWEGPPPPETAQRRAWERPNQPAKKERADHRGGGAPGEPAQDDTDEGRTGESEQAIPAATDQEPGSGGWPGASAHRSGSRSADALGGPTSRDEFSGTGWTDAPDGRVAPALPKRRRTHYRPERPRMPDAPGPIQQRDSVPPSQRRAVTTSALPTSPAAPPPSAPPPLVAPASGLAAAPPAPASPRTTPPDGQPATPPPTPPPTPPASHRSTPPGGLREIARSVPPSGLLGRPPTVTPPAPHRSALPLSAPTTSGLPSSGLPSSGVAQYSPATARRSPSGADVAGWPAGRRRRIRVEARCVFKDLVDMAAIPPGSYAVDEEIDGALCVIKTDDGYEVFSATDGAKHEVRFFDDEEAAYFYLFGVLAAEAIRSGRLVPQAH